MPPKSATEAAPAPPAGRLPSGRLFDRLTAGPLSQLAMIIVLTALLYLFVPAPSLAISILIYGLWAVSLNLMLGYGGLVSFGHALYWGYGAYAAGLVLIHFGVGLWLSLLAAMLIPGAIALAAGYVCLRRRDVYFSMLTLAFAQLAYFVAFEARWLTHGDDGLSNIPTPAFQLPGVSFALNPIRDPSSFFFLTAVIVIVAFGLLLLYTESPLGRVLQAIRESEERARACGYNTRLVQLITFTVAGMFAGLSGGLNAISNGFVGLEPYWELSGVVVIMVILGGRSTLFGSMLGATTYLLLQHYLSNAFAEWQLILGAIFVAIVLSFPQGIWGLVRLEPVGAVRGIRRLFGRAG